MAFDLGKAKEKVFKGRVEFAGESLVFEFVPGNLNEEWSDKVSDAMSDDGSLYDLCDAMCDVLRSWNMQVDGEDLPLDPERMTEAQIPIPLLGMINDEINKSSRNGGKSRRERRSAN